MGECCLSALLVATLIGLRMNAAILIISTSAAFRLSASLIANLQENEESAPSKFYSATLSSATLLYLCNAYILYMAY